MVGLMAEMHFEVPGNNTSAIDSVRRSNLYLSISCNSSAIVLIEEKATFAVFFQFPLGRANRSCILAMLFALGPVLYLRTLYR
jgi:hypothetical protein